MEKAQTNYESSYPPPVRKLNLVSLAKKAISSMALLLFAFTAFAQEPMSYSKVIPFEGQSATDLYQKAKVWVASSFPYASKVIQMDDPSQKMMSLKSNMEYSHGGFAYLAYEGWVNYNIMIQCRDGRARVQILNISHENKPGNAPNCSLGLILDTDQQFTKGANKAVHNKVCQDIKEKMQVIADTLFDSFEKAVNNSALSTEDDW